MKRYSRRGQARRRIVELGTVVVAIAASAGFTRDLVASPARLAAPTAVVGVAGTLTLPLIDSLFGRSGKLRARFISRAKAAFAIATLERLFGDSAVKDPAMYTVDDSATNRHITFFTLLPFTAKHGGRIGSYLVGFWPFERRHSQSEAYDNPDGFIEVTAGNADTYVSEHFRLRDFLTHDQEGVWPKYLVLNERLIDKLELVIDDLNAHGVHVEHMAVMSGFRTPEYNRQGVRRGGRARDSRHQYGDAADVYVDNDYDGRMDDLNHDGRVDTRDAKIIRDAVDRVEAAHPELVGGVGVYHATASHGPFTHIDARGTRARWGRA